MANVFISYPSSDKEASRRVAAQLASWGHQVWFDEWEIEPGDSIVERIQGGLTKLGYLLLCCSGSTAHSRWVSREWMSSLARQLRGDLVTLIPLRLDAEPVPVILGDIAFVDLSTDWDRGMNALKKSLAGK